MQSKVKQVADTLKLLANGNRLQILCALIDGPKTVTALGFKVSDITQSALSQHLALLKANGIVSDQKSGQSVTYSIADRRVEEVIAVLKRNYCDWDVETP